MDKVSDTLLNHKYKVLSEVGNGNFSKCYLVLSLQYNTCFVAKAINLGENEEERTTLVEMYNREINALTNTIHRNIIRIYDHFNENGYFFIILEHCSGGTVMSFIKSQGRLSPSTVRKYAFNICSALSYCKEQKIAHHDIKPDNIFIDSYDNAKLADFGLAQVTRERFSDTFSGSLAYMAPEVIDQSPYDPYKADVWSLGVTVYQMALGKLPFNSNKKREIKVEASMEMFEIDSSVPYDIKRFIKGCLKANPSKRKTFEELINIIKPKERIRKPGLRSAGSLVYTSLALRPSKKFLVSECKN